MTKTRISLIAHRKKTKRRTRKSSSRKAKKIRPQRIWRSQMVWKWLTEKKEKQTCHLSPSYGRLWKSFCQKPPKSRQVVSYGFKFGFFCGYWLCMCVCVEEVGGLYKKYVWIMKNIYTALHYMLLSYWISIYVWCIRVYLLFKHIQAYIRTTNISQHVYLFFNLKKNQSTLFILI